MGRHRGALVGLVATALAAAAHFAVAQPPGGPGGGRGPGRGGRPFEVGQLAAVSEDGKTLTLTSEFGQNAAVNVTVGEGAAYYTAWDVEAKDIEVGDVVALRGTPVKLQADQVQVGADVQALLGLGGPGPNPPGGQAPDGAPAAPRLMVFGMVSGTVVQTDPLTVDVNGLQVEIALSEGASLTKVAPMDQPQVAVGDRIIAAGQRAAGPEGALTASAILVDTTANGLQPFRGRGGFGGGRGGPGGGPGGPPGNN